MEENGYENYSRWIDVIQKKCETMDPDVVYDERISYYKLDNGIGVFVKDGKVECIYENYVWPLDINEQFSIRKGYSGNSVEVVRLMKFEMSLITYKENTPGVQYSDYQDSMYLPSAFSGNYHDGQLAGYPDLNPDMRVLLREAANRAIDNKTKKEYEGAIDFIERLEHIIEQEKHKDEKENGYEKYSKWFDAIERACNETNLVVDANENAYFSGAEHYVLGNSLHVYKKANVTTICDEELGSRDKEQVMSMERYNYNRRL